jgi:hypothetical protein
MPLGIHHPELTVSRKTDPGRELSSDESALVRAEASALGGGAAVAFARIATSSSVGAL